MNITTFTQCFQNIFTRANTPWKRLYSTNTTLQTREPMTDSQGLDNTLFGLNDIAGNSSLNLLFRGIRVLDLCHDLWYLRPFICCFLLDKENKNVTSFYLCAWAHIHFYISALELLPLCVMLINNISQNLFSSVLCVDSVQNLGNSHLSTHSSIFNHPTSQHPAWRQYLQSGSILVTESKQCGNTRV